MSGQGQFPPFAKGGRGAPPPEPVRSEEVPGSLPLLRNPTPFGGGAVPDDLARWINDTTAIVPPELQALAWAYMSPQIGLGKFDPRMVEAQFHRSNAMAGMLSMAVPRRRITTKFVLTLENFSEYHKINVLRAALPQPERQIMASQFTSVEQTGGRGRPRNKLFGIF